MYIFRALNELDIEMNPQKNGVIAKSIYDDVLRDPFEFLVYATFLGKENPCLNMPKKDLEEIYHDIRNSMDLSFYATKILSIADKRQQEINENIKKVVLEKDSESAYKIINIFKTKNAHLTNGSSKDYPWISFTKDLRKVRNYYLNQSNHEIVVVDSQIQKFTDIIDENFLLALDLSDKETIRDNEFIINSDGTRTALNFRGLNYSKSDNEVIYYNKVPKEKIVTVLKALQYELITNGFLTEEYYRLPKLKQYCIQITALSNMKRIFEDSGEIFDYILSEYYGKNKSFKKLEETGKYNIQELQEVNQKIMQKLKQNEEFRTKILS